jgi:hypothetical protein
MTKHDLMRMILEYPMCHAWTYEDGSAGSLNENPMFDFPEDLDPKWKVLACVIAYNQIDYLTNYRTLERVLNIPKKELQPVVKELKALGRLTTMPTFSACTGLISGSGFYAE